MRISRIFIENFRNFEKLDVSLNEHAVIVGENKTGKSNLIHALRLVLDPSLPDSARYLRNEDFWDGLARPLGPDDRITISIEITDFEDNVNILALLGEHLVEPDPMVARLTYLWQPRPDITGRPTSTSDYEYIVFGSNRPDNHISSELRHRLPFEVLPALRDCEHDLSRWSRSPLRPLLDRALSKMTSEELNELADDVDYATSQISDTEAITSLDNAINRRITDTVGEAQSLNTSLRFSPADPEKLIRSLKVFIDDGERSISDASLGSANLLYFILMMLEYEELVAGGDRDHTFLAIEEPEAHLHPSLQRLMYLNYLKARSQTGNEVLQSSATILMTTHSPHIASVTPLRSYVQLRFNDTTNSTNATSTANLPLAPEDVQDLERYIDVNRGELLFSRGVILVEGEAEKYIIPTIAKIHGYDLDKLGIILCSISGTHFLPYLQFLGPNGLNIPVTVLTDYDPINKNEARCLNRLRNQILPAFTDNESISNLPNDKLIAFANNFGVFVNEYTLEVDLFNCGLHSEFCLATESINVPTIQLERMINWTNDPSKLDCIQLLKDLNSISKGRFSQRLAATVECSKNPACPDYILQGINYVVSRV